MTEAMGLPGITPIGSPREHLTSIRSQF